MKTTWTPPAGTISRSVTIGDTMYLFLGSQEEWDKKLGDFMKLIRKTGEQMVFANSKVWFTKDPIVDLTKSGSSMYIWDKSGNKVKCNVTKHLTMGLNVDCKSEVVGTCFTELD